MADVQNKEHRLEIYTDIGFIIRIRVDTLELRSTPNRMQIESIHIKEKVNLMLRESDSELCI